MKIRVFAVCIAAVFALAACGSSPSGAGAGSSSPTGMGGTGGMSPSGGMGSMSPSGGPMTFAFGEPGKPGQVNQTVTISMLDALKFDPARVSVKMGDTVKFEITNTGAIPHEFVLGDQATQDQEEAQMAAGSMMTAPNAVQVQPGGSATVLWKFTTMGPLLYGCHEPGHYAAGMVGTINVTM
jgi:uncharacterized cupredoxin-like copper-binding protein